MTAVAFNATTTKAVAAFEDGNIDIYQLNSEPGSNSIKVDRSLMLNPQVIKPLAMKFSPDDRWLAHLSENKLTFIDLEAVEKLTKIQRQKLNETDKIKEDPKKAAEAHWEAVTAFLDEIKQHYSTQAVPSGSAGALAFNPTGDLLAIGTATGWQIWNVAQQESLVENEAEGVYALTFSPDGRWFAWGDANGIVRLWAVVQE